ncbi:hypothetical protein WJX77_005869 [Trebouxia sp. C0004]
MDDRANDAYALGITLFSLLSCATRRWGLMFQPSMAAYQQIRAAAPSEKTTKIMLASQEQQTVWAKTNPYYGGLAQHAMPWQLQAVSFSCPGQAAANALMSLLSGLLHPDPALRTTAEDVSQIAWLAEIAEAPLPRCPTELFS